MTTKDHPHRNSSGRGAVTGRAIRVDRAGDRTIRFDIPPGGFDLGSALQWSCGPDCKSSLPGGVASGINVLHCSYIRVWSMLAPHVLSMLALPNAVYQVALGCLQDLLGSGRDNISDGLRLHTGHCLVRAVVLLPPTQVETDIGGIQCLFLNPALSLHAAATALRELAPHSPQKPLPS